MEKLRPIIMTDASCDMPASFIKENNIPFLGLICHFNDKDYEDDFGTTLSYSEFYSALREGAAIPSTSQINEFRFYEKFKELISENRPIIYIGMSSGLSGTVNSAKLAKERINEEFPNSDITVIDTKCSSIGEGLLVYHAVELLSSGASKEEIISWIESNMLKMNHWFMVQNLDFLKRGGRISSSAAAIGNLLNINPIICILEDGTLKNVTKARGKKKALNFLIDKFKERVDNPEDAVVAITHGDCIEDANLLKEMIIEQFNVKKVIINTLGLGMGAHCGPGMLSLCFIGNER